MKLEVFSRRPGARQLAEAASPCLVAKPATSVADNAGGLAGRTLPGWHPHTQAIENSAEGAVLRMTKSEWVLAENRAASATKLAVQKRGGNAYNRLNDKPT